MYGLETYIKGSYLNMGSNMLKNQGNFKVLLSSIVLAVLVLFGLLVGITTQRKDTAPDGVDESSLDKNPFIHVDGMNLVNKEGNQYQIKGINFGNNVWDRPKEMPWSHHNEASYKEIAKLGFNTVRFYLNYDLFESDENPFEYREEGFTWLDRNIAYAKKYNIKLILDMHIPQGGPLNLYTKLAFWTNKTNQDRFVLLWKKIAYRYRNEETILGYGLLNEPYVPELKNTEDSLSLWVNLSQKTVDEIRKVDKYHMIFLERVYGCINLDTSTITYPWGDTGSFRLLNDSNTVYEYHIYEPVEFTHQGLGWSGLERKIVYGDTRITIPKGKNIVIDTMENLEIKAVNGDWKYFESDLYQLQNKTDNGFWEMVVENLGEHGKAYIDDLCIKEYDSSRDFYRILYRNNFSEVTQSSYWAPEDNQGKVSYISTNGANQLGCLCIEGTITHAMVYENSNLFKYFRVKQGNYYQICGNVQFKDCDLVGTLRPTIQFNKAMDSLFFDESIIRYQIGQFIKFSSTYNVPIYMGEFGTSVPTFSNGLHGEVWVEDVFKMIKEYKLNFGYHDYHEQSFGYYTNVGNVMYQDKNKKLEKIFKKYLVNE